MNLLYVDFSGLGLWDQRFMDLLERAASPGTRLQVRHLEGDGLGRSPFLSERPEEYYGALLRAVREAEEGGFDAVMLGCASEPGLRAAVNAARIPVVGPFGAALHISGLLGRRLGVLCPAEGGRRKRPLVWHEHTVRLYGMAESQVAFRLVDVRKPDSAFVERCVRTGALEELREEILARYRDSILGNGVKEAYRAVAEDRAEVLFFACTLWGGLLAPIAETVDVPVLDPVVTLLKATEAAVLAAGFSTGSRGRAENDEMRR